MRFVSFGHTSEFLAPLTASDSSREKPHEATLVDFPCKHMAWK